MDPDFRQAGGQPAAPHPDDAAVDRFAAAMKAKLADARAKGRSGWDDPTRCSQQFLSDLLRGHVDKGDPRDVANFCMMLHQRGESILPAAPSGEAVADVTCGSDRPDGSAADECCANLVKHQQRAERLAEALRDARRALAFAAQHLPECNEPYERANAALHDQEEGDG